MIFMLILITTFLFLYWKYYKAESSVAHLPGPRPLPFIGNLLNLVGVKPSEMIVFGINLVKKHGPFVRFLFGPKVKIIICDPKDIEALLVEQKNIDRTEEYDLLALLMGEGLITVSADKWHAQRKITNQGFQFRCLKEFVKIFEKNVEILVAKMKTLAGKTVDVFPLIKFCTLDNVCGEKNFSIHKNLFITRL
jgi:cytochrome P450